MPRPVQTTIRRKPSMNSFAFLLCLALAAAPATLPASPPPFVMTTSVGAPLYKDDGSGLYNQLVREIFTRLGIAYELVWLPSQRSLAYTDNGTYDGNIARTRAIERRRGNMPRIPEKVFDFEFLVYSKRADLEISGWQSLDPYVVGIINGWKIVERNTTGARLVTRANDYEQLFNLLQKDRVDVAVLDRVMGGWKLKQTGFDIAAIEPPILKSPMFIYVHESHAELVPRIASVVAQMKADGSFAAIYENALPGYRLP